MKYFSRKPALIVSILFKKKGAVGGMAQRFSLVGAKLIESGANVELLATRSLGDEFGFEAGARIHLIEDAERNIPFRSWFLLCFLLVKVAFGRYRQVHIAGAGRLLKPILLAARISRTRTSCTFASRTLEMASYGRDADRRRWVELLDSVDAIDVLNPGHDLDRWKDKISVSPCSFPSKKDSLGEFSGGSKDVLAVFCGALEKNKNPLLALDIVLDYWQAYGSVTKLVIFGKGVLETEVRDRMEQINKQVGVEVARFGNFECFSETLQAANVFFSLQELDNYPSQAAMEGMLMGCKVIATDEGDTRLLLPESEPLNAVVRSRDAKDFISYLRLANEDLRPSIENANHIQRNHNLERFSNYLASFLGERSE
ncbi:glycosyltransferase [Halopseudomonas aestusnigri]|uniref:glycosyltransferase n=1 Tax=Halopseudomonas aestusnigri TaxID=857252 RepID=UPI002552E64E|nr:glycosyltransferase [Halopseudomonas aestusnigri]MDL2200407.1 glycosyltransferase [Halopseudomonas aestusnigri]